MHRGNLHFSQAWLVKNHRALKLFLGLLALTSLACNAFAGKFDPLPEPPQVDPRPAATATAPAMAATVTLDAPPAGTKVAAAVLVDLNMRSGPGVQYDRIGFLTEGSSVDIVGRDTLSGWWKIACPPAISGDECWVSGGTQYVRVGSADSVPTAVAPATPTTIPPAAVAGQGWLAYVEDGWLYVAGLGLDQTPSYLTSAALRVSRQPAVHDFAFSPDGRRLAYLSAAEDGNSLHVVNVDGADHRTLIISAVLPPAARGGLFIDQIQWLPAAAAIAFNTRLAPDSASAGGSQEDFWTVTLDGRLVERFPPGEGAGRFLFDQAGQPIFSRAQDLARASLEPPAQEILLQYAAIDTAGEAPYYPLPQLPAATLHVALPAANPWLPGAQTQLWQAPAAGPLIEIGRLRDIPLQYPPIWSPDGRELAFIQQPQDAQQPDLRLHIAGPGGGDALPYAGGSTLDFLGWSPWDDRFLYAGTGYYAVGRLGAPPRQVLLPADQTAVAAWWVNEDNYLIAVEDTQDPSWQIQSAATSGETSTLHSGAGPRPPIAVWLPQQAE